MRIEKLPDVVESPSPLETPIFQERVVFLNESQWWSQERLEAYQLDRLRYLLWYAEKNIPFYKKVFAERNFSWVDFTCLEDLRRLPIITKKDIQENPDSFLPEGANKVVLYHRATGGSSGTPVTVYMDLDHLSRDKANTEYYMQVAGLDIFSHRSIRLYGDAVPNEYIQEGAYWYRDGERKLVMSCYHINELTASAYVEAINKFGAEYIHTRPSAISPLAACIQKMGLKISKQMSKIFCDGEYLTNGQRSLIEEAFGARVFNVYGHTEGCVFGHSCDHSTYLHFPPQVGVLELLDNDGNWVLDHGGRGEMIVTGFNNLQYPLIRYRTGDIGVRANGHCDCGRNYTLLQGVEGRMQDYVVGRSKNIVPLAPAVFNYNDFDWHEIREFQVVQEEPGKLEILVVHEPRVNSLENLKSRLLQYLDDVLGSEFQLELRYVDDIERTMVGKHRYLNQKIDMAPYFLGLNSELNF